MAAECEVNSFVNKFMNLYRNGEKADLSLNCEHGRIVINLQLHLHQGPPAPFYPYPPPRPQPRPYHHPSPSRVRRSERRRAHAEQARAKSEKTNVDDKTEEVFEAHSQDILVPAEQADTATDGAEEAFKDDDVKGNKAEEASDKVNYEKIPLQHSEVDAAEQASLPAEEKVTKYTNKSEATSVQQQRKNLLVCNYCDKGFANEEVLRDHTEIDHQSGRIRYRII